MESSSWIAFTKTDPPRATPFISSKENKISIVGVRQRCLIENFESSNKRLTILIQLRWVALGTQRTSDSKKVKEILTPNLQNLFHKSRNTHFPPPKRLSQSNLLASNAVFRDHFDLVINVRQFQAHTKASIQSLSRQRESRLKTSLQRGT